jgi:hypothetical protein
MPVIFPSLSAPIRLGSHRTGGIMQQGLNQDDAEAIERFQRLMDDTSLDIDRDVIHEAAQGLVAAFGAEAAVRGVVRLAAVCVKNDRVALAAFLMAIDNAIARMTQPSPSSTVQ